MSDLKDLITSLSITAAGLARSPAGRRQLVKLIGIQVKLGLRSKPVQRYLQLARYMARLSVRGALLYVVVKYFVYRLFLHPANKLPGPAPGLFPFLGHFRQILAKDAGVVHREWANKYGPVYRYFAGGNNPSIMVAEPELVKQILTNNEFDFVKPPETKHFLTSVLGQGLLVAEGQAHRHQRKMLNPAFGPSVLHDMVPLMIRPTQQLIRQWHQLLRQGPADLVVSQGLGHLMLEIIGIAGFGTEFDAIRDPQHHPITRAYTDLFSGDKPMVAMLSMLFPWVGKVPFPRIKQVRRDVDLLRQSTQDLVLQAAKRTDIHEKNDLLALMIRQVDDDSGRKLSVKELQDQCLTFLAAGHETTSVAVSWCLHTLAHHPEIQDALRKEVSQVLSNMTPDNDQVASFPTFEDINHLSLLNNVCKETLRFTPPVPLTHRIAIKDFELQGNVYPKGTRVVISPMVSHFDKRQWGDDVDEFKPSRWDKAPANIISPYVYLPFLAGGRQCIGYRFALLEFKVVLALLIKNFKFTTTPGFQVRKGMQVSLRPLPNMTLHVESLF
ncbi:cytochrome P450 [Hesseltinella vesiculosa]|uniref:Cytochrome P450 n=1 Tax=Hesseltinella vesiculosa TaxID=101127 RepID=A0A1X2G7K2_9FUNG|nr:cytochrome P450 [Hesseltinella vesiculosa]